MSSQVPTFNQQAYEYVKANILNSHVRPGQYITDSEVARALNISRTPVREAFQRLENEGLLTYEPRRGWRVYVLHLEDINEIFELKIHIEALLCRKAAENPDPILRMALRKAFEEMNLAARNQDADAWIGADTRLHTTLYRMAGNERAAAFVKNLNEQWHRLRIGFSVRKERMQRSVGEHELLVNAVLAGDGQAAEKLISEHLDHVRSELVELLVHMVLPFAEHGV